MGIVAADALVWEVLWSSGWGARVGAP